MEGEACNDLEYWMCWTVCVQGGVGGKCADRVSSATISGLSSHTILDLILRSMRSHMTLDSEIWLRHSSRIIHGIGSLRHCMHLLEVVLAVLIDHWHALVGAVHWTNVGRVVIWGTGELHAGRVLHDRVHCHVIVWGLRLRSWEVAALR